MSKKTKMLSVWVLSKGVGRSLRRYQRTDKMERSLAQAFIIYAAVSLPTMSANGGTAWKETRSPYSVPLEETSMIELPSAMFRRWTHSREEDTNDITVYRPLSFPFPPSRGREAIEFRENGEFIQYRIGATDRSEAIVGRWRFERSNLVEVDFEKSRLSPFRLILISVDNDLLKVKREDR